MATAQSARLLALARSLVEALPAEVAQEIVLTGSVSRGVADDVSDVELLVVTPKPLTLETCFAHAKAAGLSGLDSWGPQDGPTRRVFGYHDGVPFELIWWSRAQAEREVDALLAGTASGSADALFHGMPLRTTGLLAAWQERLRAYPDEVAAARIEDAALTWGGFAPAGLLTIARPGERLALVERLVDDAARVVRIVFALNRVWQPTHKRLAARVAALAVAPPRLAERIEEALTEPAPLRALLVMTELQAETVALAPGGPNVDRARRWLAEAAEILAGAR